MIPNHEKLYRGVSHAAWAYFFLYFDINLGSLNILPDFMCYVLLWSAIGCLEEEERDLTLLRPLCVLLGVWAGADWVFTLLGGTLDGRFRPMDLLISVAAIYFHFQLFTDFARLAARYQPQGEELDGRLLRLRTVHTLLLTAVAVLTWPFPNGTQFSLSGGALPEQITGLLLLGLALAGLVVALMLMFGLFSLRKYFRSTEET